MRAAVFHGQGDVRVEEVAAPGTPAPDEVVIDVVRAAICGSDSSEFAHGPMMIPLDRPHPASGHFGPVVMGHEFFGVVREVGAEVDGVAAGDRVVPGATNWCGECVWCRQGRTNLCRGRYLVGMQRDGGLAEAVTVPAKMCRPVPEDCDPDGAAIAQPLAVALHGLDRAATGAEPAVLIGAGGIGSLLVAAAKQRGVDPLIVIDVADVRLENAARLGADHCFKADDPRLFEKIEELTDGDGPPLVIEASGAPGAPATALKLARPGARVLLMGLQAAPRELDLSAMTQIEIDVITSNAHVCDQNLAPAISILAETDLAERIIGERIGLSEIVSRGLEPLAQGRADGKIVVDPQR